jgi:hypothetical protein
MTKKLMTKDEILSWADAHQGEWFAQVILNCWDDEDFENIDKDFFEDLRDAMNESHAAATCDAF